MQGLHNLYGQFSRFYFVICFLQVPNAVMLFRLSSQAPKFYGPDMILTSVPLQAEFLNRIWKMF